MSKSRDIFRRMKSVDSTRKITHTMEMVATAKLAHAQQRVIAARPYSERLANLVSHFSTPEMAEVQPLLRQPSRVARAAVVLLTSNRGLCGAFNANLIRAAQAQIRELEETGASVEFHVYGNKGISYFSFRGIEMAVTRNDLGDPPALDDARRLTDDLAKRFMVGELDSVRLVFAAFKNMVSTPPSIRQILPAAGSAAGNGTPAPDGPPSPDGAPSLVGAQTLDGAPRANGSGDHAGSGREPYYILDPPAEEILDSLMPLYVTNLAYSALLETAAAEQASRRKAMKSATDNANDFLDNLRRNYNRARQAEITNQIAEIIGGADALGG